ncbi:MAG: prolyl oligopeptidase family serine peptidase, partial [Clostridia bacterium]|nr:prolyl oligopeptidase family serine peptidase [Clostridia bacterium]
ERVQDPHQAMFHGYMKYVREQGKEYPFIFIAPQCIGNAYWGSYTESLSAFLDYILETYAVDRRRVYLTGLSMGGTGTWMFAMARPNTFAAIMPVCGSGIYWNVANLLKTPIYMVHGDCDTCVPISCSVEMLTSINSRGGNAKLKICYGVGHDAWNYAYTDDSLLEWMLSQRLPE